MKINWKEYQEEVATFFRSLGLSAETDVSVEGVRTKHNVDVVVKSVHAGFDVTWLVECKLWKTPVPKVHVLALRDIVHEVGADRGILLSESGFQSGASEAATLTNVQLASLAELRVRTTHEINAMRMRELFDRLEICSERYWEIPKEKRIRTGLRPDFLAAGYSGDHIIMYCKDLLAQSMRGRYPFTLDNIQVFAYPDLKSTFSSPTEVVQNLEKLLTELEDKLAAAMLVPI